MNSQTEQAIELLVVVAECERDGYRLLSPHEPLQTYDQWMQGGAWWTVMTPTLNPTQRQGIFYRRKLSHYEQNEPPF